MCLFRILIIEQIQIDWTRGVSICSLELMAERWYDFYDQFLGGMANILLLGDLKHDGSFIAAPYTI